MRYNPDTDRAVYNERVQAESQERFRAGALARVTPVAPAPVAPQPEPTPAPTAQEWGVNWSDLEHAHYAQARCGGRISQSYATCCNLSHSIGVARAMGNFAEARRLQAQLVARLY